VVLHEALDMDPDVVTPEERHGVYESAASIRLRRQIGSLCLPDGRRQAVEHRNEKARATAYKPVHFPKRIEEYSETELYIAEASVVSIRTGSSMIPVRCGNVGGETGIKELTSLPCCKA